MSLQKTADKLPRQPSHTPVPTPSPVVPEKIKKESQVKNGLFQRLDFTEGTQFMGGPQRRGRLKLALWTWASMVVDHCLIMAMTCLFLLTGSLILKTTLKIFIRTQDFIQAGVLLYVLLSVAYFVIVRSFLGATVGEQSCGLRLGAPSERFKKSYSLKVLARSILILFTGIVILPLLSLFLGKDLTGKLTGLSIYSLK